MIKWFDAIEASEFHLVGGKGYNLSRMYQEGISVPNGFVIDSTAYDAYIEANNLGDMINGLLQSPLPLASQSDAIKKLFVVEKLSENLVRSVLESAKVFDGRSLAVRSSATVEDLPGMSFAGQYSSFLHVTKEQLFIKIIQCWRSLWNVRAMDYRVKHQVSNDFSLGVVIQEMIEAKKSGVIFTANPINGLRHELVINSSFGLGEAIVGGEVNPDQYTLDKISGELISKVINTKQFQYKYASEGIEKVAIESQKSHSESLSSKVLRLLVGLANKAESYFGQPQDMEFAVDQLDNVYVLQSRDITTLFPIDALEQDGKLRAYMSAGTVLLGMKEPFTNLGFDLMSTMFPTIINVMTNKKKNPLTNNFVRHAGNRMFVDMSYLLSSGFVAKQFAKTFSGNDLPLQGVMTILMNDYGKVLKHQGIHFRIPFGIAAYSGKMIKNMKKITKIPNAERYSAMKAEGNRWYGKVVVAYEKAVSVEERLNFAEEALVDAFKLSQVEAMYCIDINNYIKIEKILKKHFGTKYHVETLAQSLPGCFTQTMTMQLNKYAKHCHDYGQEPSKDDPVFKKILKVYGHRGNIELDFGTKRWNEDPTYLLDLVKTYMNDQMYERNLQDHKNKKREAEQMMINVTKDLGVKIGKKKAKKFKLLMKHYRYGAAMREYPKSDIVRFLALGRRAVLTIGDDFVKEDKLDHREDIFFLYKDQLLSDCDHRSMAQCNKASYNKEMQRTSIPRMLLNNGHTYYSATISDPDANVIQGMALSAGTYEGQIRVVMDPMNSNLKEGEIMVTETTNPAWTPLFATAGALIMAYGGPMSHGGIVAREYGIPAVVGIPSATEMLKDGQRVRVNGETGVVELLG